MKTNLPMRKKFAVWISAIIFPSILFSQNPITKVFEDWNTTSGSQNMFQRSVTRSVPGTTNIVVAGATLNSSGNFDILVQKLNGSGVVLWTAQYNGVGNGNDIATDVRVASNGEIYACGTSYKDATDSSNAVVLKYDPNGNFRWIASYNGSGSRNDGYSSLLVSGASVVAVGSCWSTSNQYDMLTRRLDTAGATVWTTTYDQAGLADGAISLSNRSGSIFVTGGVQTSSTAYKIATWKITPSTGAITSTTLSSASSISIDRVNDVQEDASGNVYVAGTVYDATTGFDFKIFKYDASLSLLWSHTWDGAASLDDGITGLALDQNGSVIVTGYTGTATGNDFATVKYSSAGVQQWASTFDGGGSDSATCIVVNQTDTNKIYVSGYSYNGATNDYWTMRYDGGGNEKWSIGSNSIHNANDIGTAIALDTLNNIIVTGQNEINDSTRTYTTVKYVEKSTLLPQDTITATSNSFIYTENRGQLLNTDTLAVPQIRYYVLKSGSQVYFTDTAVSYVFSKLDTATTSPSDTLVRVDMKYKNANADVKIRAMDVRSDYENFFLGHIPEGRSRVQNYDKLVSFNVWNNVDVMYGSNLAGMKTYFICKPGGGGGAYANIDLQFAGADSVKIDGSGHLIIYTQLGNLIQPKAAAWQIDGSGNFSSLGWQPSYNIVAPNEVKFTGLGSYNSAQTLIFAIDWGNISTLSNQDNLVWSTFYGGGGGDGFTDVKVTVLGKQVVCGSTASHNFPVTTGAVQTTISNGTHNIAVVVEFKADNSLSWATYFGGSASPNTTQGPVTFAMGVDANENEEVFFTGWTNTSNFPHHHWGSAYDQTSGLNNGCSACTTSDAFVVKLSADGQINIWSTLYGGDGEDFAEDIKLPLNGVPGDWYFGGFSNSTNFPFPNTLPAWSGGTGFFVRSNDLGVPSFGSYIGSSTNDRVYSFAVDQASNVVMVGAVGATGFPILEPSSGNTGNSSFGGGRDAFITKLDDAATPNILWSTYYGGTSSEAALDVVTNNTGASIYYYVTGEILSISPNTGLPPLFNPGGSAYYQSTQGGGFYDAFVLVADANGNIPWATLYGGNGDDHGTNIAVDFDNNIYIAGKTESTDLGTASPDIFPSPNLGNGYVVTTPHLNGDNYLSCFNHTGYVPVWGTYYGGNLADAVSGLDCYHSTALYMVGGNAGSSVFPLYDGLGVSSPCTLAGTPYTDFAYSSGQSSYVKASIARFCLAPIIAGVDEESTNASAISVFPNPSSTTITITGTINTNDEIKISLYDLPGRLIEEEKKAPAQELNAEIDVSEFANGVYIIQLATGDKLFTQKIIIQR